MKINKIYFYILSLTAFFYINSANYAYNENIINNNEKSSTQASELKNLNEKQIIDKLSKLFQNDQKQTGILASVSMAQFILESGWGKSALAQNANNLFGMKSIISNNTWKNSVWDGQSHNINTRECDSKGKYFTENANFRSYDCIEKSIQDHSEYLINAMKDDLSKRYVGISGCKDYKKAFQIIKDGGYATDPKYVDSLCEIVQRYNLTTFDKK